MVKKFLVGVCAVFLIAGMLSGCGRKAGTGSHIFDSASPDLKQVWDGAMTADKSNDYVTAITGYHQLMAQKDKLTPDQIEAVNDAALAVNQRMYTAANNGDAAAKDAQAKLAQMQGQHP